MLIEVGGVLRTPSGAEYEIRQYEQNMSPIMKRPVTATGYAVGLTSGYRAEFVMIGGNAFFITHFSSVGSPPSKNIVDRTGQPVPVRYYSPFEYKLLKTTEGIDNE